MKRPMMIYDGDCRFCTLWIARWRAITGDRIEYRAAQEARADFPEVPAEAFEGSVQFIDTNGQRYEHAAAVFRSLATGSVVGRVLANLHDRVPAFRVLSDAAYRFVARHRMFFSRLTRLAWGCDMTPPTYALANTIFLRLLGLIYLIAFISFGWQASGLLGTHGILPVSEVFPQVARALGSDAWWQWPTLLWLRPCDDMLFGLTWMGVVCAVLAMAGMVQPLALAGAWVAYLSLVVSGQEFYSFQWDILLLEAGLLSVFAAPWCWLPNIALRSPGRLAHFMLVWLLFRLMFSSGVVKITSEDPTWANLTALGFHYWTQPIPNVVAWYFAQAPAWFQKLSGIGMFTVELVMPFLVFFPRRLRLIAFAGFVSLQFLIGFTGNYGFFNLLALALALLLVDDAVWPQFLRRRAYRLRWVSWPRWVLPPLALAYVILSLVPLARAFRASPKILSPVTEIYRYVAPFRSINGYGLFAVMTTERPEIILQGSMDGLTWKNYEFKYKPGALNRRPPQVAPYMPRLDWQMWFAALGDVRASPWMAQFVMRLFQAEPEVLALLDCDPFGGQPPRYLRANLENYRFTDLETHRRSGNWWMHNPRGVYFSEIRREQIIP